MEVIRVRNVREALPKGIAYLLDHGVTETTRAGEALVAPTPVTTVYSNPLERVLLSPTRDANPFFHLFEALWLLAGRNDAKWLDQFVGDFSSRFAEEDGHLHGSYGYRWRKHFDLEWGGHAVLPDQLNTAVRLLKMNPSDRQVVITMWDPVADLDAIVKDRPCNLSVMLRVRPGDVDHTGDHTEPVLDITVTCRSNDIVWGAYGANAVQFSVLQEYLAARIGVGIGTYYQVSNNYHVYKDVLKKLEEISSGATPEYNLAEVTPIVTVPEAFDADLERFFEEGVVEERLQSDGLAFLQGRYQNPFFSDIAEPLYWAHRAWKQKDKQAALRRLSLMPPQSDWRIAAWEWMARRWSKMGAQSVEGVGPKPYVAQVGGQHEGSLASPQPVPLTEENHYAERFDPSLGPTLSLSAADKGEAY